jgi:lysophospholipase L1-like esterase
MTKIQSVLIVFIVALAGMVQTAAAQNQTANGHWVSAWSTAVQTPLQFPGMAAAPGFENQTVRMVIRPTISGQRLRVRLSNELGAAPLAIGAAHVALVQQGSKIVPGSDRTLTFNGEAAVTIPAGAPMLSDPVDLKIPAFAELAVSLYVPGKAATSTTHSWAQHESYIASGNQAASEDLPGAAAKPTWYWLAGVEFQVTDQTAAVIAFGDSITDGNGAKQGEYGDWPDQLAKRIAAVNKGPAIAIDNEGIGGNRILHDGAGVSALTRLDRDVLSQPGVTAMIVLEGINDIGWAHMKMPASPNGGTAAPSPFAGQFVSAKEIIGGLQQIVERAHEHGIRVFGATMTPYEGADYFTADGEEIRQAVNKWICTGGALDGVFDFDAVVRDPAHPAHLSAAADSGDHLHPSTAGYKLMVEAIDLAALRGGHK